LAVGVESARFQNTLHCDGVRVRSFRRRHRGCTESPRRVRKTVAAMKDRFSIITGSFALVSCTLFLWMFFAAATLERTADLGGILAPPGYDARAVAYEFAARWRHGMAGNSPIYMPGFFAAAIALWFWSAGKSLSRILLEGSLLISAASVCAL